MVQGADDIIHADRLITSRQTAVQLSVSNGTAMATIDTLGHSKVQDQFLEVSQLSTDVKESHMF
jgi:hypothetical protein